jgi:hypothetical protein
MDDDNGDDIVARSVKRAIAYIEANPGLTYTFNTKSIVQATNDAGKALDKVIEGGEGHSGSSWHAAFFTLIKTAKDRGYTVVEDKVNGLCSFRFAGAAAPLASAEPPNVCTGSDISVMRPMQYKHKA